MISADGKGIVMCPDGLRTRTVTRAARAGPRPKARLSRDQKCNHKRMAGIGAVYDATAVPRTAADILPAGQQQARDPTPGPTPPTSG